MQSQTFLPPWRQATLLVWGKTDRDDPESLRWLPLVTHLTDSCLVGGYLFDQWLSVWQRRFLSESLGGVDSARSLLMLLCGLHDIGKCSPCFAQQALFAAGGQYRFLVEHLRDAGFEFPPTSQHLPHGTIGQVVVTDLLQEFSIPTYRAVALASVIGGHHGKNATPIDISDARSRPDVIGTGTWDSTRREIFAQILELSKGCEHLPTWAGLRVPAAALVMLQALVIVADWLASGTDLFPYDAEPPSARLQRAMALAHLNPPWQPTAWEATADSVMLDRFAITKPTEMQKLAVKLVDELSEPGLVVIQAPTGSGKTEAAMLCAERLAGRFGCAGTFWGLPTMATANPMFQRVYTWLNEVPAESKTLHLVHSKAQLNEDFAAMARLRRMGQVYDEGRTTSAPEANQWFLGRKRSALVSHVVGTIDQMLFSTLQAKHVVLRSLSLFGKVVVIDEVHAADDYMRVYLCRALEWLGAMHAPVILMSATLPHSQLRELVKAYADGRRVLAAFEPSAHHATITVVTDQVRVHPVPVAPAERLVRVQAHSDDISAIAQTLTADLTDGGCAAVICNTVRRAQAVYLELSQRLDCEVELVHSKFIAPHRLRRERMLVNRLGKDSSTRPERLVVVGTQVLEQSLDVDFDLMVSDVAPADLLVQRWGRLHRHERERPARLREATCYLTGITDWSSSPPVIQDRSTRVYPRHLLLRSLAALTPLPRQLHDEADQANLIQLAYGEDLMPTTEWQAQWSESAVALGKHREDQISRANQFLIAGPRGIDTLMRLTLTPTSDPERAGARAQVRDADESLEVLLIQRDTDGRPRTLPNIGVHSDQPLPLIFTDHDWPLAKAIATCTVALPAELVAAPQQLDATIAELEKFDCSGWQVSPWLSGQLFVCLDSTGRTRIAGVELAYDQLQGLRVIRAPESSDPRNGGEQGPHEADARLIPASGRGVQSDASLKDS